MTTIATLVGLAPMAIHRHPGDEMNLPLARAVIGGLTGSTLLTLFVVPILYSLLKPKREKIVTAGQVVITTEAPPSDPAATFEHVPHSDWAGTAFSIPGIFPWPSSPPEAPVEPPPPPPRPPEEEEEEEKEKKEDNKGPSSSPDQPT
jgi:hypothetical protein